MTLDPLKQWRCDSCGEVIAKPEDGWVEWLVEDGCPQHFRICHHVLSSPLGTSHVDGCHLYGREPNRGEAHLVQLLGPRGIARLLEIVRDSYEAPRSPSGPDTASLLLSWDAVYKRLHVPDYEESRLSPAARAHPTPVDESGVRRASAANGNGVAPAVIALPAHVALLLSRRTRTR